MSSLTIQKRIAVYQVQPAAPDVATWLNNLLKPVVDACKFQHPLPVEFRPIKNYVGYASRLDTLARVCISTKVRFGSKSGIIFLIVHEWCHQLVHKFEDATESKTEGHGPIFFLTLMVLYRRLDLNKVDEKNFVLRLGLYDFQDVPAALNEPEKLDWQGEVLNFANANFEVLACSDFLAEELPNQVSQLWFDFVEKKKLKILDEKAAKNLHDETSRSLVQAQNEVVELRFLNNVYSRSIFTCYCIAAAACIFSVVLWVVWKN